MHKTRQQHQNPGLTTTLNNRAYNAYNNRTDSIFLNTAIYYLTNTINKAQNGGSFEVPPLREQKGGGGKKEIRRKSERHLTEDELHKLHIFKK